MQSRWRAVALLCLGVFIASGAIIYCHGYMAAFLD
jgi:hypothetical protein